MIRNTILDINKKFIDEGKNSPHLFEDLAQLEHYIAESYGNRVLIELLQNADDAKSSRGYLYYDGINLYFANNGRVFDENDIIAISRSGSSNKDKKESIGYRGVGFKSTTFLTNDIMIFSNNVCFTFSSNKTKEALSKYGISKSPTVRIPFLIEEDIENDISDVVNNLMDTYNTVFVFRNPQINVLKEELDNLDNDVFIFLNNIKEFKVQVEDVQDIIEISKEESNIFIHRNKVKNMWKLYSGKKSDFSFNIAFKTNGKKIIQCNGKESVLHVFLPTLDKLGFPFKINGHFSTDPSRKHVNFDDTCKDILNSSAELIVNIVKNVFESDLEDSSILEIITTNNSLSKFSIYFEEELYGLINSLPIIKTKAGNYRCISDIKKPLKFLSMKEYNCIIDNYVCLNNEVPESRIDSFRYEFLEKFCTNEFNIEDLSNLFSKNLINISISHDILGKLFANLINETAQQKYTKLIADNIFLLGTSGECFNLNTLTIDKKELSKEFTKSFSENIYKGTLDYFYNTYKINLESLIKETSIYKVSNNTNSLAENESTNNIHVNNDDKHNDVTRVEHFINQKDITMNISKWRSAELQCVEIEKYLFGNKAKDVSKQNKGYDVESIDNNGNARYIEVKSLKNENDYFTLTNNEYTTAHMYGKQYFICLIISKNSNIKVIYINDPINSINMEKRVKMWEWFCDNYKGDEFIIDISK